MLKRIITVVLASLIAAPASAGWTTPRTWVAGELVTAALLNIHLRDNINHPRNVLLGAEDLGSDWLINTARPLKMSSTGVAHGMTTLAATDVYGHAHSNSSTSGTLQVEGFSDNDSWGIVLWGTNGSNTGVAPPLALYGSKKNGTGRTDIADADRLLEVVNNGTTKVNFYGDGKMEWIGAGVAHGMTTALPGDIWGQILINSAGNGGMRIRSASETDTAMNLVSFAGTASPTAPVSIIDSYKRSGTSVGALASGEIAFAVAQNGSHIAQFRADATAGGLVVNTGGVNIGFVATPTNDSLYIGDANFGLDWGGGTAPELKFTTDASVSISSGDMIIRAGAAARVTVYDSGDVVLNANSVALATNATTGFTHLPSMAGSPSGTPAVGLAGNIPIAIDTANSKLMAYIGGAWVGVTLAP